MDFLRLVCGGRNKARDIIDAQSMRRGDLRLNLAKSRAAAVKYYGFILRIQTSTPGSLPPTQTGFLNHLLFWALQL